MKKYMSRLLFALILATCSTMALGAEEESGPSTSYCQDNKGFDDWDFWVGDWKVYSNTPDRPYVGSNAITKHYANCLIKETWEDAQGNGGFSVNFYNPVRGQWRQVWISNGYSIDYTGGLNEQGQMVLEGEIDNYLPNNSQQFRGIWTPQENGDVVQRFEVFNAESESWTVWFEGLYVRQ